jgi:uncharacterized protein (DUF2336 family)
MMTPESEPVADITLFLDATLSSRSVAERSRIIREVAAQFLKDAARYSAVQVDLFDRVIMQLIDQIHEEVRVYLADELKTVNNAPRSVIRRLASDAAIEVAGPVLTHSSCLDDDYLVQSVQKQSQQHLLAISLRNVIGFRVTEILAERGDDTVVLTLAQNEGAEFSERGCALIVERANDDAQLARVFWNRPDIPRQHVLALFRRASETVKKALIADSPARAREFEVAIEAAHQRLQEKSQESSEDYAKAKARIEGLKNTGGLAESHILAFARRGEFEAAVTAVAEMSKLSASLIERMLLDASPDRLFVLLRAIGLPWICARQLLLLTKKNSFMPGQLEKLQNTFHAIARDAASKTLQFHQLREKALCELSHK